VVSTVLKVIEQKTGQKPDRAKTLAEVTANYEQEMKVKKEKEEKEKVKAQQTAKKLAEEKEKEKHHSTKDTTEKSSRCILS
jgi:hypothetical protein